VILPATDRKTPYRASDVHLPLSAGNQSIRLRGEDRCGFSSMKELIDEIRKRPGKLNFATVGGRYSA
jgi:hypothetical protein